MAQESVMIKLCYRSRSMNRIGPRVREIREQKQWTQEQLVAHCQLIDYSISRGTLAKIESQVRRVTDIEVAFLARALSVPIKQLFDHN